MVGRGDDTHTLPDQGFYREPRSTNGSVEDECNVHPAFIDSPAHATHQPADGARVHREPHLGMSLMEDGQKPRQPVSEERLGGAHRERARHFSRASPARTSNSREYVSITDPASVSEILLPNRSNNRTSSSRSSAAT